MEFPGSVLRDYMIPVFCFLFDVEVWVHCGLKKPVVYRKPGSSGVDGRSSSVHIQCISGLHYNPLVAFGSLEHLREIKEEVPIVGFCDIGHQVVEGVLSVPLDQPFVYSGVCCKHTKASLSKTVFMVGSFVGCALLDTGAQISLISESVFERLRAQPEKSFSLIRESVNISGIGSTVSSNKITECHVKFVAGHLPIRATFTVFA